MKKNVVDFRLAFMQRRLEYIIGGRYDLISYRVINKSRQVDNMTGNRYIAEGIGTFMLVFSGCSAIALQNVFRSIWRRREVAEPAICTTL
mgnify:CR=1 FL=1